MYLTAVRGLALLLLLLASSASADDPRPLTEAEISALIPQLANEEYVVREKALKQLRAAGARAIPQLQTALSSSPNAQARIGITRLLDTFKEQQRRADRQKLEQDIAAFVEDADGSQNRTLPGWKRFQEIVGDAKEARLFYARMIHSESKLLEQYIANPDQAAKFLETRFAGVDNYASNFNASTYTIAAIMFVAGDKAVKLAESTGLKLAYVCSRLHHTQGRPPEGAAILKPLEIRWLDHDEYDTQEILNIKINLPSNQQRLGHHIKLLSNLDVPVFSRLAAMQYLFSSEAVDRVELLEPSLKDTRPCGNQTEIRDVALVVLLNWHKLDLKDFSVNPKAIENVVWALWRATPLFEKAQDRERAMAKWEAWYKTFRPKHAELLAFLADVDGKQNIHPLGWKEFREIAGDSLETRKLYFNMLRSNRKLLEAYWNRSPDTVEILASQFGTTQSNWWAAASDSTAATYMLVGGDPDIQLPLDAYTHINSQVETGFLTRSEEPLLRLVDRWMQRHQLLRAQLKFFVATGRRKTPLAGWEVFRKIAGSDPTTRAFFIEMQYASARLLETLEQAPEKAAKTVSEEIAKTFDAMDAASSGPPTSPTLATYLLVSADKQAALSDATQEKLCRIFLPKQVYFRTQMSEPILQKLFDHWLKQSLDSSKTELTYLHAEIASVYNLKEYTDLVLRVALDPKAPAEVRAKMLLGISAMGTASDIARLEPLLKEQGTIPPDKTELREIALATLVELSGQAMKDYHFPEGLSLRTLLAEATPKFHTAKNTNWKEALAKWQAWSETEHTLRQRLEAFKNAPQVTKEHTLPGWKLFQEIAGDTPEGRALFCEMQLAERELLETYEKDPKQAETLIETSHRRQEALLHRNQKPSAGGIGAILLVGCDKQIACPEHAAGFLISALQYESLFKSEHQPVLQKLVQAWITRPDGLPTLACRRLALAGTYNLKPEALALTRELLNKPAEKETPLLAQQAECLGLLGNWVKPSDTELAEYLKLVEPFLSQTTVVQPAGEHHREIQLCDVALAAVVELTGQDWKRFRLKYLQKNPTGGFQWQGAVFDDANDRQWALDKWRTWTQTTPGPGVKAAA